MRLLAGTMLENGSDEGTVGSVWPIAIIHAEAGHPGKLAPWGGRGLPVEVSPWYATKDTMVISAGFWAGD